MLKVAQGGHLVHKEGTRSAKTSLELKAGKVYICLSSPKARFHSYVNPCTGKFHRHKVIEEARDWPPGQL